MAVVGIDNSSIQVDLQPKLGVGWLRLMVSSQLVLYHQSDELGELS